MPLLTQTDYAKRIGVSQPYISKLIKLGKLHAEATGKIDPAKANAELKKTLDPGQMKKQKPAPPTNSMSDDALGIDNKKNSPSFSDARTANEIIKAKIAKLEYDKLVGTVIDRQETEKQIFDLVQTIRDSLLQIPDRISPKISSDHSIQHQVRQGLLTEITNILEEMTIDFCKKASL